METMTDEVRKDIWAIFKENQVVHLATIDGEKPKVRPVTMGFYEDRFWFMTGMNDNKMKQINQNPNVELCLALKEGESEGTLRIGAIAEVEQDRETKARIAPKFPFFNQFWESIDDPTCALIEFKLRTMELMKPGEFQAKFYEV